MILDITDFALRHFNKKGAGTKITSHNYEEFMGTWNDHYRVEFISRMGPGLQIYDPDFRVSDGDEPHIKYVTIRNFTNAKVGVEKITNENYQYLRSGYSSRRDSELPVLSRWFELPLEASVAKFLVLVLYSKEQLEIEHTTGPDADGTPFDFDADWGVVAILGQNTTEADPMTPITAMRNALGVEFGGSGVPIDKDYYEKAIEFWSTHALVK